MSPNQITPVGVGLAPAVAVAQLKGLDFLSDV